MGPLNSRFSISSNKDVLNFQLLDMLSLAYLT